MKREMGRSWLRMLSVCVLFLGPTLEGCAQKRAPATSASSTPSAPTAAPLLSVDPDSSGRIAFGEFSVVLPPQHSWQRMEGEYGDLGFGTRLAPMHSLAATVRQIPLNMEVASSLAAEGSTDSGDSTQALARAMASRLAVLEVLVDREKAATSTGRLRLTSFAPDFNSDYVQVKGQEMRAVCARYDAVFEDSGVPYFAGVAFPERTAGLICIPVAADAAIHIAYDERRLPEEAPLASFDTEAREYFDSLQFTGNAAGAS